MNDPVFDELVQGLAACPEVDAILLAGSKVSGMQDEHSDYDVYVYLNRQLPVNRRKAITDKTCTCMEFNNQFWETEDDGILNNGIAIDLIYRSLDWLDQSLDRVVFGHQASLGYSTCLWANLLQAKIIFDRQGRAQALQQKYAVPFPAALQHNIIRKNFSLLKAQRPAYYGQIKTALLRGDVISLNHRLTEFLASYFDILFAINEVPHPGEKRLLVTARAQGQKLPKSFEKNIRTLLRALGNPDQRLLDELDETISNLESLLWQEGLLETQRD